MDQIEKDNYIRDDLFGYLQDVHSLMEDISEYDPRFKSRVVLSDFDGLFIYHIHFDGLTQKLVDVLISQYDLIFEKFDGLSFVNRHPQECENLDIIRMGWFDFTEEIRIKKFTKVSFTLSIYPIMERLIVNVDKLENDLNYLKGL